MYVYNDENTVAVLAQIETTVGATMDRPVSKSAHKWMSMAEVLLCDEFIRERMVNDVNMDSKRLCAMMRTHTGKSLHHMTADKYLARQRVVVAQAQTPDEPRKRMMTTATMRESRLKKSIVKEKKVTMRRRQFRGRWMQKSWFQSVLTRESIHPISELSTLSAVTRTTMMLTDLYDAKGKSVGRISPHESDEEIWNFINPQWRRRKMEPCIE